MAPQVDVPGREEIAAWAEQFDPAPTADQAGRLAAYLRLLMKWNRKMNLVGPRDWRVVLETLVADSMHLANFLFSREMERLLPDQGLHTLDFGAGAGLPGIPLRLFWTKGAYHLIESRTKRAVFLRQAAAELGLPETDVFEGRAETFLQRTGLGREGFSLCLSRAFMPWPEFLSLIAEMFERDYAVLLMTNALPDAAKAPRGLAPAAQASYVVGGAERYFSVFAPAIPSR